MFKLKILTLVYNKIINNTFQLLYKSATVFMPFSGTRIIYYNNQFYPENSNVEIQNFSITNIIY